MAAAKPAANMLDEAAWPATGQASSLAAARIWALVVSVGMKVNGNDEVWEVPEGTRYCCGAIEGYVFVSLRPKAC